MRLGGRICDAIEDPLGRMPRPEWQAGHQASPDEPSAAVHFHLEAAVDFRNPDLLPGVVNLDGCDVVVTIETDPLELVLGCAQKLIQRGYCLIHGCYPFPIMYDKQVIISQNKPKVKD